MDHRRYVTDWPLQLRIKDPKGVTRIVEKKNKYLHFTAGSTQSAKWQTEPDLISFLHMFTSSIEHTLTLFFIALSVPHPPPLYKLRQCTELSQSLRPL